MAFVEFLMSKNIWFVKRLQFSVLWTFLKISLKKVLKKFGGKDKSVYLCTRFRQGSGRAAEAAASALKEITSGVVQKFGLLKKKF